MRIAILVGLITALVMSAIMGVAYIDRLESYGLLPFSLGIARTSLYAGLAAGTCIYAILCGGGPERFVGVTIIIGLVADPILHSVLLVRFQSVDPTHLFIDLTRLAAFVAIAMLASRYWTIWLAALQLLASGAHLAKWMALAIHPVVYATMAIAWSYGMLILVIFATRRHQRLLARGGTRKSWSDFSRR